MRIIKMKMTQVKELIKRAKPLSFKNLEVRKSWTNLVLLFEWNLKVCSWILQHNTHQLSNLNDASLSDLWSWQKLYLTLRGNISILTWAVRSFTWQMMPILRHFYQVLAVTLFASSYSLIGFKFMQSMAVLHFYKICYHPLWIASWNFIPRPFPPFLLCSALIPCNEALLLGPYKNLQAIKLIFILEIIFLIAI